MRNFRIPCSWQQYGVYEIQAETLEDAIDIAEDEALPDRSSYIEDSFTIHRVEIEEWVDEDE